MSGDELLQPIQIEKGMRLLVWVKDGRKYDVEVTTVPKKDEDGTLRFETRQVGGPPDLDVTFEPHGEA